VDSLFSNARNEADLVSALRAIDISVPGRAKGRKNEHREQWTTCRLLATLASNMQLSFPISLTRRSPPHPDYSLTLDNLAFGIEVTEATYRDYNRALDLRSRKYPGAFLDIGLFVPARYDASENRIPVPESVYRSQLERNTLISEGWSCAEPDWVRAIRATINRKQTRLIKYYRHISVSNWLAIESNLPCDGINLEKAMSALCNELEAYWDEEWRFERIFIEKGQTIIRIGADGWKKFAVHDLWRP
jgi:hypothetical protein